MLDGLPVELDSLVQWGVGDRLLRDLLPWPRRRSRPSARSGGAACSRPAGSAGAWRRRIGDEAAPVAEIAESSTQGRHVARSTSTSTSAAAAGCAAPSPASTATASSRRPSPGSARSTGSRPGSRCSRCVPTSPAAAGRPAPSAAAEGTQPPDDRPRASPSRSTAPDRAARPGGDLRRRHARAAPAAAEDRPRLGAVAPPGAQRPAAAGERPSSSGSATVRRRERGRRATSRSGVPTPRSTSCWGSAAPGRGVRRREHPPRRPGAAALAADPRAEGSDCMEPFDLLGELPDRHHAARGERRHRQDLRRRCAGARYVAEGVAALDEMLVITFGRAASQELRERVREQLVEAERALADPRAARDLGGAARPAREGDDDESAPPQADRRRAGRLRRRDDRHHPPVLPAGAALARRRRRHRLPRRARGEPRRPGRRGRRRPLPAALRHAAETPPFKRARRARSSPARRSATRRPSSRRPTPSRAARPRPRSTSREAVRAEVDRRKRRLGILSTTTCSSRLADALEDEDAPRATGCASAGRSCSSTSSRTPTRCSGSVLDRAFTGHATLVLIGDPKQAIYAFRGGDVFTYLEAAGTAATRRTLATNWRSDAPLVEALQAPAPCRAGRPAHRRAPGRGAPPGSRLAGLPSPHPLRLRVRPAPTPARRHRRHRRAARAHRPRPRRRRRAAARLRRHLRRGRPVEPVRAGDVASSSTASSTSTCSATPCARAASRRSSPAAATCCSAEPATSGWRCSRRWSSSARPGCARWR